MSWNKILRKEEPEPQFVDPENQEDEEMERVEKFLGRFKKPQPMPLEQWMKALNGNSGSLEDLVYFIITLDTTDGGPLDLLWDQKQQGAFTLQQQVAELKKYGNTADEIVNMLKQRMPLLQEGVEESIRGVKRVFSSTLNIRRYAEPLLRQIVQQKQAQGGQ